MMMSKEEFLARIIVALASNPTVFDPNLANSDDQIEKIARKLNKENFAVKRLWDCAKDIVELGENKVWQ